MEGSEPEARGTTARQPLRVLMVIDSIASNYGGVTGFARLLRDELGRAAKVDILAYHATRIALVQQNLRDRGLGDYDLLVIQMGASDLLPRLPGLPLRALRRIGLSFVKETLFYVPPKFGLRWLARLPLWLIRLFSTRLHKSALSSPDEVVRIHKEIVAEWQERVSRVLVLPLVEISPRVYGHEHARGVRDVNGRLKASYGEMFVTCPSLEREVYQQFYSLDWIHLRQPYHHLAASELLPVVLDDDAAAVPSSGGVQST